MARLLTQLQQRRTARRIRQACQRSCDRAFKAVGGLT